MKPRTFLLGLSVVLWAAVAVPASAQHFEQIPGSLARVSAAMVATPALAKAPQCPSLCLQPIAWSNSFQYDTGMLPRVAWIGSNEVLEVHQGEGGGAVPLWYHLGYPVDLNSGTQRGSISWAAFSTISARLPP